MINLLNKHQFPLLNMYFRKDSSSPINLTKKPKTNPNVQQQEIIQLQYMTSVKKDATFNGYKS